MNKEIEDVGRIIGLNAYQITLITNTSNAFSSTGGAYIPHTAKWQRIAKGLVLDGYLTVDHHSDDDQSIAVKFEAENAQAMVDEAKRLTSR